MATLWRHRDTGMNKHGSRMGQFTISFYRRKTPNKETKTGSNGRRWGGKTLISRYVAIRWFDNFLHNVFHSQKIIISLLLYKYGWSQRDSFLAHSTEDGVANDNVISRKLLSTQIQQPCCEITVWSLKGCFLPESQESPESLGLPMWLKAFLNTGDYGAGPEAIFSPFLKIRGSLKF